MIAGRPLIPPTLKGYLNLRRYKKEILSLGVASAFMQCHEMLLASAGWGWESLCFCFPGVANPLSISRYPGAHLLGGLFDEFFFPALNHADVILAAADDNSIQDMIRRSRGLIARDRVIQFPTRVDTSIFHPAPKDASRAIVDYPEGATVIVTCGRVHWAKGWQFLIDAFQEFRRLIPNAYLCFIGDGQDRGRLEGYAAKARLSDRIRVTGFLSPEQIAAYLNAADVFALASYKEGWATVLVEALSCGVPLVSTRVSSAAEIIIEGKNGFIVDDREPDIFAQAIFKALSLENVTQCSVDEADRYSLKYLSRDMKNLFPPLKG
jgi:glycosyltransferase involved in cell wall biosynthesis